MKRLRRFRSDPGGVSPVIGEVLMVAIVIIMTAIIWLLVSEMLIEPEEPMITVHLMKPDVSTRGPVYDAILTVNRVSPGDQSVLWTELTVVVLSENGSALNQSMVPCSDSNATYHDYVEVWYVEVTPGDTIMTGSDAIKITGMSTDYEGATVILLKGSERIASIGLPVIFG